LRCGFCAVRCPRECREWPLSGAKSVGRERQGPAADAAFPAARRFGGEARLRDRCRARPVPGSSQGTAVRAGSRPTSPQLLAGHCAGRTAAKRLAQGSPAHPRSRPFESCQTSCAAVAGMSPGPRLRRPQHCAPPQTLRDRPAGSAARSSGVRRRVAWFGALITAPPVSRLSPRPAPVRRARRIGRKGLGEHSSFLYIKSAHTIRSFGDY